MLLVQVFTMLEESIQTIAQRLPNILKGMKIAIPRPSKASE